MRKLIIGRPAVKNLILPLTVMMLWGSLFPCIKMGYREFNIDTGSIPEVLMFAALRFIVCGAAVCLAAHIKRSEISAPKAKNVLMICLMGVFAILLHYGFTYVGLSVTEGSKAAILKQAAPLLFSCFSFLFIKGESFSAKKMLGAIMGFSGIIAINAGTAFHGFSAGDILIILASLCTVISMTISGRIAKGVSPLWITGISQLFGGAALFSVSLAAGGKVPSFTLSAALLFLYICAASITGYTLFYFVQRTAELSRLFIIKFAEPLFACIFSAMLLGENILRPQYLAAFLLISFGIIAANSEKE